MREVIEKLSKDALVDIIERLAKGERIEHVIAEQVPTALQTAVTLIHLCRCRDHREGGCTWYEEKNWQGPAHIYWLDYVKRVMEAADLTSVDDMSIVANQFAVLSGQILATETEMKGRPSMQSALRQLLIGGLG